MNLKIYQVDAFTDKVFGGNPAAVVPLKAWPEDGLMQKIAMENNQAETAFYVPKGNQYEIRWFTPEIEVDLCGHATLATAFVLFNKENHSGDVIEFYSHRSGRLKVTRDGDYLTLDFPTDKLNPVEIQDELAAKQTSCLCLKQKHRSKIFNLTLTLSTLFNVVV
jgi:PhzF family phenazine biosynthesis protein